MTPSGPLLFTILYAVASLHAPPASTLIVGARVLDGSGSPAQLVSVRIIGDRIADVGNIRQRPGDSVIVGNDLVLAPGFIDTHSHADDEILTHRDALADVSQGVTTIVGGQDGGSNYPLADYFAKLEKTPGAINVASYVGHGTLRSQVMGKDFRRAATAEEVTRMQQLLATEMKSGALGLSTGLEYDPGIYSDPSEVLALARTAAADGGRYISHMRSEDRAFWSALDELITIGRENKMPVQVSHMKLGMRSLWGQADSLTSALNRARASGVDVTADIYPYTAWHSDLEVLFPKRDFDNRASAAYALSEVVSGDSLWVTKYAPEPSYTGKRLSEISAMRHSDDTTTLMALIKQAQAFEASTHQEDVENIIGVGMSDADVAKLIAWPWSNICSDGELDGPHPRGFGAFTKILRRYVRELHVLTLEEAVRKMTTLAASNVGIDDRGRISVGMYADLVLFDPTTVTDKSTMEQPHAVSIGIRRVWVNGVVVFDGAKATGAFPGRVVRRPVAAPAKSPD